MKKTFVIDIYAELEEDHIGEQLLLNPEDGIEVRCVETGEIFTGIFIVKDLEVVKTEPTDSF